MFENLQNIYKGLMKRKENLEHQVVHEFLVGRSVFGEDGESVSHFVLHLIQNFVACSEYLQTGLVNLVGVRTVFRKKEDA